jgi:hypothetical protein
MPFDPDSPFVRAGADEIDDWFVPGQPPGRIAPWSPGTEAMLAAAQAIERFSGGSGINRPYELARETFLKATGKSED